jgi:hypothetical protein
MNSMMTSGLITPKECVLLTFILLMINTLSAQVETKLIASDGEAGDFFGRSVAIEGEYIMVGASNDDNEKGTDAGSAYIFQKVEDAWVETQKLIASEIGDTAFFGYDVDIDGDLAVIGACWSDDLGEKTGSAYIFRLEGSEWIEEAKLTAHDAGEDDRFGISVSISGNYAVVGSFFDDDNGSRSGSAYIFKKEGASWTEQAKLTPGDGSTDDWFGVNVSVDGDYVAVGSRYNDNEKGTNAGAVYVYKREEANWIEQTKLLPSEGFDNVYFDVCEIDGANLVVGAWGDGTLETAAGAFYIFHNEEDSWLLVDKLFASDINMRDNFGRGVAIHGDRIVIGSFLDDDNGGDSGSGYIFRWNGAEWYEEMKLLASDGDTLDNFGLSVDIDLNNVVVGARQDDDRGVNSGAVYVYQLESTSMNDFPAEVQSTLELMQNYPNPFNTSTRIEYVIERNEQVSLLIYNSIGQVVRTLISTYQPAGKYIVTWDGKDENGFRLSSGEYYFQLFVGENMESKKAILIE